MAGEKLRTIAVVYSVSEKDFQAVLHAMHGPPVYNPNGGGGLVGGGGKEGSGGTGAAARETAASADVMEVMADDPLIIALPAPSEVHGALSGKPLRALLQRSFGAAAASLAWEQSFRRALWTTATTEAGE